MNCDLTSLVLSWNNELDELSSMMSSMKSFKMFLNKQLCESFLFVVWKNLLKKPNDANHNKG